MAYTATKMNFYPVKMNSISDLELITETHFTNTSKIYFPGYHVLHTNHSNFFFLTLLFNIVCEHTVKHISRIS